MSIILSKTYQETFPYNSATTFKAVDQIPGDFSLKKFESSWTLRDRSLSIY